MTLPERNKYDLSEATVREIEKYGKLLRSNELTDSHVAIKWAVGNSAIDSFYAHLKVAQYSNNGDLDGILNNLFK